MCNLKYAYSNGNGYHGGSSAAVWCSNRCAQLAPVQAHSLRLLKSHCTCGYDTCFRVKLFHIFCCYNQSSSVCQRQACMPEVCTQEGSVAAVWCRLFAEGASSSATAAPAKDLSWSPCKLQVTKTETGEELQLMPMKHPLQRGCTTPLLLTVPCCTTCRSTLDYALEMRLHNPVTSKVFTKVNRHAAK